MEKTDEKTDEKTEKKSWYSSRKNDYATISAWVPKSHETIVKQLALKMNVSKAEILAHIVAKFVKDHDLENMLKNK